MKSESIQHSVRARSRPLHLIHLDGSGIMSNRAPIVQDNVTSNLQWVEKRAMRGKKFHQLKNTLQMQVSWRRDLEEEKWTAIVRCPKHPVCQSYTIQICSVLQRYMSHPLRCMSSRVCWRSRGEICRYWRMMSSRRIVQGRHTKRRSKRRKRRRRTNWAREEAVRKIRRRAWIRSLRVKQMYPKHRSQHRTTQCRKRILLTLLIPPNMKPLT